jgi:ATP-binding cassette subfamily A (ABC1) protein 3
MRMSGMPNWMHWLAWMMNSMLFLTISVTIVVVLFCSSILNHDAGPIIAHGSPAIWWIVLMLYVLSSTAFLFFISSFFQRRKWKI